MYYMSFTGIYTYTLHMTGCEAQRGNRNFESQKFACFYIVPIAPPPLTKVFFMYYLLSFNQLGFNL